MLPLGPFLIGGRGTVRRRLHGNRELHQTIHRRQLVVIGGFVQVRTEQPLLGEEQPESLLAVQAVHLVSHSKFAAFPRKPQDPEVLSLGYCRIQANTLDWTTANDPPARFAAPCHQRYCLEWIFPSPRIDSHPDSGPRHESAAGEE